MKGALAAASCPKRGKPKIEGKAAKPDGVAIRRAAGAKAALS